MNQRQKLAIQNHCRLAVETLHPRFGHKESGFSVILTVNSGHE